MLFRRSRFVQVTALICVCGLAAFAWIHFPVFTDSVVAAEKKIIMEQELFETRRSLLDCPVDAILCGEKYFGEDAKRSDLNTLRSEFHRLVTSIDFHCPKSDLTMMVGVGYEACMAKIIRPNSRSCLIYSFGISNDWSFDEAWAKYGCEVHSFDPSLGKQDHMHAPNVSFHNLGLWGSEYTNKYGWKLDRLSTIIKKLGHEKRIIDALKIDIEGAEWPFLRDVTYADPSSLSNVRQLYFEIHTPRFKSEKNMTATDYAEINDYIRRLRDVHNFQLYKNLQNNWCCARFSGLMPPGIPEKCCHETLFFNPHLLAL